MFIHSTSHKPYIKFQVQEVTINIIYLSTWRNAIPCLFLPATEKAITRAWRDPMGWKGSCGHLVGQPLNPDAVIIAKILWQYDLPIYTLWEIEITTWCFTVKRRKKNRRKENQQRPKTLASVIKRQVGQLSCITNTNQLISSYN